MKNPNKSGTHFHLLSLGCYSPLSSQAITTSFHLSLHTPSLIFLLKLPPPFLLKWPPPISLSCHPTFNYSFSTICYIQHESLQFKFKEELFHRQGEEDEIKKQAMQVWLQGCNGISKSVRISGKLYFYFKYGKHIYYQSRHLIWMKLMKICMLHRTQKTTWTTQVHFLIQYNN